MSWSYDPKLEANKDKVRFLIDDTDDIDQQLQDEEIAFALSQCGNIYRAAADLCETLAVRIGKTVGVSGGVNWDPAEESQRYRDRAESLRAKASETGGVSVFAGGISVAGRQAQSADTDRVKPAFTADLHSNSGVIDDAQSWNGS